MSRLLFAAAREARIETLRKGSWIPAVYFEFGLTFSDYRIHPDDTHLAYGPISTALRDAAEQPKILHRDLPSLPPYFAFSVEHETESEWRSIIASDELTHSLFLLIVAEALADDGL